MSEENLNIPFQIQRLVDGMNNKKENDHTRANFRATLESIKRYLEKETYNFDVEMGMFPPKSVRNGRK